MSNAIKFTPQNGVVSIIINIDEIQELSDNQNFVKLKINIKDTGVGISQDGLK